MRAAITGVGVVTPAGVGVQDFRVALQATRRRISELQGVPIPRGKSAVGLVHDERFAGIDRAFRMAVAASEEAIAMRGDNVCGRDTVFILSTLAADSDSAEKRYAEFTRGAPFSPELSESLKLFSNGALASKLCDHFEIEGARLVVSNACASGNIAMGLALDMLRAGRCLRVLVCGVELAKLTMIWGAERSGFIGRGLRPFDAVRDGSVLGEGAGAVILEHQDHAAGTILGWLEGFGCGVDPGAAAITLIEDGSGLRRGMNLALRDAGRVYECVSYINAHAPGTPMIDRVECKAIRDLMGAHADRVLVNSTKSITTHMSAASAVVETAAVLLQMRDGFVHGNAGLEHPDTALLTPVAGPKSTPRVTNFALSNACGGGGLNTSVALSAPDEPPSAGCSEFLPQSRKLRITGTGVVSPAGASSHLNESTKPDGRERLDWFDVHHWYARETQFGYMNRAAQLGAAAGFIALEDSGAARKYDLDRVAVLSGTLLGGTPESSRVLCQALHDDPNSLLPSMALDHGIHLAASLIRRAFGFYGISYTLTGSGGSGLLAVQAAADSLLANRADAAVVVASDSLDPVVCAARPALNGCLPDTRLSEGAAAIVIEQTGEEGPILSGWTAFSVLPTRMRRQGGDAARRVIEKLGNCWNRIYYTGSAAEIACRVASHLAATSGASIHALLPGWYCMSATPMFALCAAAACSGRSLVLSIERDGVVVAMGIEKG